MAPGHTFLVDDPRPHTLLDMLPDHTASVGFDNTKCVAWSNQLKLVCTWPGAIKLKSVAWGHLFEVCEVCSLGPSTESVWPGAINLN